MNFTLEIPEVNLLAALAQRAMMSYQEAHALHVVLDKLNAQGKAQENPPLTGESNG